MHKHPTSSLANEWWGEVGVEARYLPNTQQYRWEINLADSPKSPLQNVGLFRCFNTGWPCILQVWNLEFNSHSKPISILHIVIKVLERHVANIIMDHLEQVALIKSLGFYAWLLYLHRHYSPFLTIVHRPWTQDMKYVLFCSIFVRPLTLCRTEL